MPPFDCSVTFSVPTASCIARVDHSAPTSSAQLPHVARLSFPPRATLLLLRNVVATGWRPTHVSDKPARSGGRDRRRMRWGRDIIGGAWWDTLGGRVWGMESKCGSVVTNYHDNYSVPINRQAGTKSRSSVLCGFRGVEYERLPPASRGVALHTKQPTPTVLEGARKTSWERGLHHGGEGVHGVWKPEC